VPEETRPASVSKRSLSVRSSRAVGALLIKSGSTDVREYKGPGIGQSAEDKVDDFRQESMFSTQQSDDR